MPLRFMLDTDICIHLRSRQSSVVRRVRQLGPQEATMSVISYGELRLGAEKSPNRAARLDALGEIISLVPVRELTAETGVIYAEIRSHLERCGEVIGNNDLWIAAHARAARLTLVTGNDREFRRVPGLEIENWAAEGQA